MKKTVIIIAIVVIAAVAVWRTVSRPSAPKFCFNFVHDMQFGDRKVAHPVNTGSVAPSGVFYIPEVPALQTALSDQGFFIDPFEATGGHVYAAAFFGPSTRSAVLSFQKKYGLPQTGQVTNDTLDKLALLYSCPKLATSTAPVVGSYVATTTSKAK